MLPDRDAILSAGVIVLRGVDTAQEATVSAFHGSFHEAVEIPGGVGEVDESAIVIPAMTFVQAVLEGEVVAEQVGLDRSGSGGLYGMP
jgi:hypothetical protein